MFSAILYNWLPVWASLPDQGSPTKDALKENVTGIFSENFLNGLSTPEQIHLFDLVCRAMKHHTPSAPDAACEACGLCGPAFSKLICGE